MTDTIRLHWGVSLSVLAFSLLTSTNSAFAQTCTVPPSCAELGYDKTASECSGAIKTLHCPLDKTKVFCLTAEDIAAANGGAYPNKVAEIGDIVYTDIISAEPISGRIPVGIVYDISGKMVSLAEYQEGDAGENTDTVCGKYVVDGINGWERAKQEDMGSIKAHLDKINATFTKISKETPLIGNNSDYHKNCYRTNDGSRTACMYPDLALSANSGRCGYCDDYQSFLLTRCIRKFGTNGANDVASTPTSTYKVGDDYVDSAGVSRGIVISMGTNGNHGVIITSAIRNGTLTDATTYCENYKSGNLEWYLPSKSQIDQACKAGVVFLKNTDYWTSDSIRAENISDDSWTGGCNIYSYNGGESSSGTASYHCVASF